MEANKTQKFSKLSDFDKGQVVMAIRLGLGISEAAALVECPRAVLVPVYRKWAGLDVPVDEGLENGQQAGTEAEKRPCDPAPEEAAQRQRGDDGSTESTVSPAAPEQSDTVPVKQKKSQKRKRVRIESSEEESVADPSSPRPDSSDLLSRE